MFLHTAAILTLANQNSAAPFAIGVAAGLVVGIAIMFVSRKASNAPHGRSVEIMRALTRQALISKSGLSAAKVTGEIARVEAILFDMANGELIETTVQDTPTPPTATSATCGFKSGYSLITRVVADCTCDDSLMEKIQNGLDEHLAGAHLVRIQDGGMPMLDGIFCKLGDHTFIGLAKSLGGAAVVFTGEVAKAFFDAFRASANKERARLQAEKNPKPQADEKNSSEQNDKTQESKPAVVQDEDSSSKNDEDLNSVAAKEKAIKDSQELATAISGTTPGPAETPKPTETPEPTETPKPAIKSEETTSETSADASEDSKASSGLDTETTTPEKDKTKDSTMDDLFGDVGTLDVKGLGGSGRDRTNPMDFLTGSWSVIEKHEGRTEHQIATIDPDGSYLVDGMLLYKIKETTYDASLNELRLVKFMPDDTRIGHEVLFVESDERMKGNGRDGFKHTLTYERKA